MSARATAATAARVLSQLRRDPRTVALLLAVPSVLIVLLKGVLNGKVGGFQHVGPPLLGLFPLISMFLVTSITVLRERTTGTLERLMTLPLAKADLLAGYSLAFGAVAVLQAAVISAVGYGLLGLTTAHSGITVAALAVANAILGMALGLLLSAFAATEFQAVQFMPAFILPQLLLCGLFAPRERMVGALRILSDVLPMTYSYDAISRLERVGPLGGRLGLDLAVTIGATVLALALGSATLRRRTS
jgi:ABC-2 type transport system permease protein